MATLEAEAFLYGNWKNFAEMEENMSLPELEAVIKAGRERQDEINKFNAALKGIRLGDDEQDEPMTAQEKVEEMKRKMEAKAKGMSDEQFEFTELGLDLE